MEFERGKMTGVEVTFSRSQGVELKHSALKAASFTRHRPHLAQKTILGRLGVLVSALLL